MAWPSTVGSFSNPSPTDRLNSPSHSSVETAQNTAISEIETFVGTLSSVQGTLIYDVRATASDGGGHVQGVNKGGTGLTSYAKGDLLVASSSSVLSKLTVGTDGFALVADSSQSAGVKWGTASGNTAKSMLPSHTGPMLDLVNKNANSSIKAYIGQVMIPVAISANTVTIPIQSVLGQGTIKFAIYSEDGQTRVMSIITGTLNAVGPLSLPISSVLFTPNVYYAMIVPVSANINYAAWNSGGTVDFTLTSIVTAGKGVVAGTMTVTGGVLPATFAPSSITAGTDFAPLFRLDN